jgi:hypothetical protein
MLPSTAQQSKPSNPLSMCITHSNDKQNLQEATQE